MTDAFLFVAALLVGAAWVPWASVRRHLPRVGDDADEVQSAYERGYRRRLVLRALPPLLLTWFVARAAGSRTLHAPPGFERAAFDSLCATFVLSAIGASFWRYRWDRAFIRRHPEFAGSLQSLRLRLTSPVIVLAAFTLLGIALSSQDTAAVFGCLAAALVVLFGGQRLALAALVRSRIELPLGSPFGRIVSATVERFGFAPKRAILIPSTVANAYALPDGTVMVTTALRAIASDEEIAAVLAHELSHARDRDAPRIRRTSLGVWLLTMAVAGLAAYGALLLPAGEAFLIPIVTLAVATFLTLAGRLRAPYLHRLEFKCDRAAAEIGYGPDLARCLTKLHRHMGMPVRWFGVERRLMTHPSLADRIEALASSSEVGLPR